MMTYWYGKTIQALQLNGKGERAQEVWSDPNSSWPDTRRWT